MFWHHLPMRSLRLPLVLLLLASTQLTAQNDDYNSGMCPIQPQLGDKPIRHYSLAGTVGNRPVRMYLERDGKVAIASFYYTDTTWTPFLLGGTWSNGFVEVSEKVIDEYGPTATGKLTGKVTPTGFIGSWIAAATDPALSIRTRFTPHPSCNGAGPWKRFDDPRLPITFSYPASWQITEYQFSQHADGFKLTCPDPAKMFNQEGISIESSDLKNINWMGFRLRDGKWLYDYTVLCDADNDNPPGCGEAPETHRGVITILDGDNSEWRLYCAGGGYIGQGYGHERMLILGDRWVEFQGFLKDGDMVLRIIATARPRTVH